MHSKVFRSSLVRVPILSLAILAVSGVVLESFSGPLACPLKSDAAARTLASLKAALLSFQEIHGNLPVSLEALCLRDPINHDEPYIEDEDCLVDPWDRPYQFESLAGGGVSLLTHGADGLPGGRGDAQDIRVTIP